MHMDVRSRWMLIQLLPNHGITADTQSTAARPATVLPSTRSMCWPCTWTPGRTGHATVNIISHGKSNRSIVLVLGSYQPVNWILSLPSNVSISKVVLVSTRSHNAANWNVKQSSPPIDQMFCKINLSYRSVKSFQNILVTSRKHSLRYLGPRLWRKFPPDLTSAKALNIFKLSRIRKNDVSSMIDDGCKGCFLCSS